MKSLQNQYNLIVEGKGNKEIFMKAAKEQFPQIVTNVLTYNEAVTALSNKGIINEAVIAAGIVSAPATTPNWFSVFKENTAPDKKVVDMEIQGYDYKTNKNPNNLAMGEILNGYYTELRDPKNAHLNEQELKDIVFKNLEKDPMYYIKNAHFGVKGIGYTEDVPGLGKTEEATGKYKSSGMLSVKMNENKGPIKLVNLITEAKEDEEIEQELLLEAKKKKHTAQDHINRIEKMGEVAMWENKIKLVNEMIDELSNKVTMTESEDVLDYVDKNAIRQLKKEIKVLEKRKQLYEKQCSRAKMIAEKINKKMGLSEEDDDVVLDEGGDNETVDSIENTDIEVDENIFSKVKGMFGKEEDSGVDAGYEHDDIRGEYRPEPGQGGFGNRSEKGLEDPDGDFIRNSLKRTTMPTKSAPQRTTLEILQNVLKNKGVKK